MKRKKFSNNLLKLVIILVILSFTISSFSQGIYTKNTSVSTKDDNYYTWEDDFSNAQKIDKSLSENYIVENGKVEMYGTYPEWTNPSWTRMKKVTVESSETLTDCAVKLIVDYDSDMKGDYGDLRFKMGSGDYWLPYWIEEKNPEPNDPYAIVWLKVPTLNSGTNTMYLFYGNPSANDLSDYWSVFDEESWEKHYAHDHKVTYHAESEGAWDPDVAFGGGKFLVTWEEGTPASIFPPLVFQQQIRGCYYTEEGERSGSRFDITEEENPPYRYENPSVAYGSGTFFVAFEHYNTPSDLLSRDIEGAVVSGTNPNRFDICTSSGNQADPCVAYDESNGRFFVVWEDGREGTSNYNIYGKLFSSSGSPIGGEKVISNRPNSQCEPWIAFDNVNNHYMVVWEEGVDPENGPFEIWGQLFDTNGNPLGSAGRLSPSGTSGTDYNFPCVAFCELKEKFLVTWQEDDISGGDWYGHIWGKILDENGNTEVNTFKIANGAYERTQVVPHLSSSFFVVYDGNGDVWGKLVDTEGNMNDYVLQLSDSESDPADWASVGSSGDKIYVAWEDERVIYPPPYEEMDMPDIYSNVWSFNTPSGSNIDYNFGEEKSLILEATVTSIEINPENFDSWHLFDAVKSGDITFDILDGNSLDIIKRDVSPGASLSSISSNSIRLRATMNRNNPSTSPHLEAWSVSYVGRDEVPPVTTVQNIDGVKGLNEWYISESVIIWLHAEDFPEDTGSGVKNIYYTLNNGQQQIYNEESGLQLSTSQSSNWMGEWTVVFWASDNAGNIESKSSSENKRVIKIDSDRPYVEITTPTNEEETEVPFWVRADPSDNVGVSKVEFDIEPFGEREGLPYVDTDPPYEWYCDVEQKSKSKQKSSIFSILGNREEEPNEEKDPGTTGVNVMVRAQVYDESGQTWIHEVWVHITNWEEGKSRDLTFLSGLNLFINRMIERFPLLQPLLNLYG